jgi:prevent-host-death family protein
MKIESLREVKAKLSKIVKDLPSEKSVVITKNGRPCAVLFPVTEETDLRKHVTRPAQGFLAIAGPRTQGGREERLHPT